MVDINADLSAIIANTGSSDLTKQLAEKDDARDRAFVGFRDYCNAFIHVPDPVKSAAAEKLTRLIRTVDWSLQNQGYSEHTASQKALYEALKNPELRIMIVARARRTRRENLELRAEPPVTPVGL